MSANYEVKIPEQCINCVHAMPRHGNGGVIVLTCKFQKSEKNKSGRVDASWVCDIWEYREEE